MCDTRKSTRLLVLAFLPVAAMIFSPRSALAERRSPSRRSGHAAGKTVGQRHEGRGFGGRRQGSDRKSAYRHSGRERTSIFSDFGSDYGVFFSFDTPYEFFGSPYGNTRFGANTVVKDHGARISRQRRVQGRYEVRTEKVLVTPGRYEWRTELMEAQPGRYEIRQLPAETKTSVDSDGKASVVVVKPARAAKVWIPPRYETRNVKVWIPARYKTRQVRVWIPGRWILDTSHSHGIGSSYYP